jgi:hypothetical protein
MLKLLLFLFLAACTLPEAVPQPIDYATTYACPEIDPAQANCKTPADYVNPQ